MSDPLDILSPYDASIDLSTSEGQKLFRAALREGTKDDERVVVSMPKPQVKVFEDNQSCIAIAESSKFTPRTKHIALKYHHFRSFVKNKALEIFPIDTEERTADIFTKPLDEKMFLYLRRKLNGW